MCWKKSKCCVRKSIPNPLILKSPLHDKNACCEVISGYSQLIPPSPCNCMGTPNLEKIFQITYIKQKNCFKKIDLSQVDQLGRSFPAKHLSWFKPVPFIFIENWVRLLDKDQLPVFIGSANQKKQKLLPNKFLFYSFFTLI